MSTSNHRVAAGSKRARQIAGAKGSIFARAKAVIGLTSAEDKERAEWNARVDARKQAKKEKKR